MVEHGYPRDDPHHDADADADANLGSGSGSGSDDGYGSGYDDDDDDREPIQIPAEIAEPRPATEGWSTRIWQTTRWRSS